MGSSKHASSLWAFAVSEGSIDDNSQIGQCCKVFRKQKCHYLNISLSIFNPSSQNKKLRQAEMELPGSEKRFVGHRKVKPVLLQDS